MKSITAACFDVYYYKEYAKSCCVVFEKSEGEYRIPWTLKLVDKLYRS